MGDSYFNSSNFDYSNYSHLRNAVLGFPDGHVDHSVFNGLPKIVNGVTGLPFLGEQEALMDKECLGVQAMKDDAALNAALQTGYSRMCVFTLPTPTNPGFPFISGGAAVPVVLPDAACDPPVISGKRFVGATVSVSATVSGGTVFRVNGSEPFTSASLLSIMADGGADMNVVWSDTSPLSIPVVSHQAVSKNRSRKAKTKDANEELSMTRARALLSLRINTHPNPPYSPTTAGGRAGGGRGVGKAKTYSPVTPATAPKL